MECWIRCDWKVEHCLAGICLTVASRAPIFSLLIEINLAYNSSNPRKMIALGFLIASTVYADTEAALAPLLMSQFEAYGLHERSAAAVARSYLALAWESLDSATSKALVDAAASKLDPIAEEWETFSTASSDDCRAGQVLSSLTGVPGELAVTWQTYAPLDQGSSVQTPEG